MPEANTLPIWGNQRKEKRKVAVCGSSRPLVAFSLIEAVVFQRMYLRDLDRVGTLPRSVIIKDVKTKVSVCSIANESSNFK
jgi:hypothetical protein